MRYDFYDSDQNRYLRVEDIDSLPREKLTKVAHGLYDLAESNRIWMETIIDIHRARDAKAAISGQDVAATHIQKDRWRDVVLMEITNPEGVTYMFAIPPQIATHMAEKLKTESAKPHQT